MTRIATEIIIGTGGWDDTDQASIYAFVPLDMPVEFIEVAVQFAIDHSDEASWDNISDIDSSDWVGSGIEPVSDATRDEFLAQCQLLFFGFQCARQVLISRSA